MGMVWPPAKMLGVLAVSHGLLVCSYRYLGMHTVCDDVETSMKVHMWVLGLQGFVTVTWNGDIDGFIVNPCLRLLKPPCPHWRGSFE